ncbi:MAG TPA: hypothetical protein VHE99_02890 [Gammaproteobacteria bacterium]|nr:hypothetical protein [Gammaproteobacteria bacterium]HVY53693.1 hypothetical protein [Gammaproteobacteria bacterium]
MSLENETLNSDSPESKQYFINDDKFQQLKQCQQIIFNAIEVSPSLRKIVNELITPENLEKVTKKYLSVFKAE